MSATHLNLQNNASQLVDAWITYQSNWWAFEALEDACSNDPEAAWQTILQILEIIDSEILIRSLATGPLEDLLSQHADVFINRVEILAEEQPKFKKCLKSLWQNSISDENWQRILTARQ